MTCNSSTGRNLRRASVALLLALAATARGTPQCVDLPNQLCKTANDTSSQQYTWSNATPFLFTNGGNTLSLAVTPQTAAHTWTLPNATTITPQPQTCGAGLFLSALDGTTGALTCTGGVALTRTNDTNVTLTLGGTPSTALLTATSLTLGWTGLLGLNRGGTNADLSATGGTHQVLQQSGVGAAVTVGQLAFSDLSGNPTCAQGNVFACLAGRSGGQTLNGGTATTNDLLLNANSSDPGMFRLHGVPATLAAGNSSLLDNGASPPTYNATSATLFQAIELNLNVTGMPITFSAFRVDGTYTSGSGQIQSFQSIHLFDTTGLTATADGTGGNQPFNGDYFFENHIHQLTGPTSGSGLTNNSVDASFIGGGTIQTNGDNAVYTNAGQTTFWSTPALASKGNGAALTVTNHVDHDASDIVYTTRGRCVGGTNPGALCITGGATCTGGGTCTGEGTVTVPDTYGYRFQNHASTSVTNGAKHTNTNIHAFRCEQAAGTGGTTARCIEASGTAPNFLVGDVTLSVAAAPDANASLDMQSTAKGLLIPRIPFATLGAWTNAMLVYCTDCNATCAAGGSTGKFCGRENGAWKNLI